MADVSARKCEPMGAQEVADYLGVKRGTVHQWQHRKVFPAADWDSVNGAPAWNKATVIGWAVATGRSDLIPAEDLAAATGHATSAA